MKEYSNGEITVLWQPEKCIHSTLCWKGLISVFNPKKRPWIEMSGADSEAIRKQVLKCPSGALSLKGENDGKLQEELVPQIRVTPNGPLLMEGKVKVVLKDGREEVKEQSTAFCRCGASANKPFCDGSHRRIDFTD